jgi:hypothetical protein
VTGERRDQAGLVQPLSSPAAMPGGGGRIHRFLRRRSRAVVTRARDRAARSDEKPLQVESGNSGWFRAWVNRSYPEGIRLLLRTSTEQATLAEARKRIRQTKGAERRDKVSG